MNDGGSLTQIRRNFRSFFFFWRYDVFVYQGQAFVQRAALSV